jgi:hypothetical protein
MIEANLSAITNLSVNPSAGDNVSRFIADSNAKIAAACQESLDDLHELRRQIEAEPD